MDSPGNALHMQVSDPWMTGVVKIPRFPGLPGCLAMLAEIASLGRVGRGPGALLRAVKIRRLAI